MGRPHRSKAAPVERRDSRFAHALGERHDAGVDDPEREVRVASLQLAAASEIDAIRQFNTVDPREQIPRYLGWDARRSFDGPSARRSSSPGRPGR